MEWVGRGIQQTSKLGSPKIQRLDDGVADLRAIRHQTSTIGSPATGMSPMIGRVISITGFALR